MINGKLVFDGTEMDIHEDLNIPITYAIADIKRPQDRKRSSSKTIALRGTQNNMRFFSSAYQLSLGALTETSVIGFDFDPTIRVPAKYYRNGVLIFDGLVQLLTVEITGKQYIFNCVMFSNIVNLFTVLGELKIAELGWDEYTHELSFTNIQDSWDTQVIVDGSPVTNFTAGVPDGFGYLYANADYGYEANPRDLKDNNLFLGVYHREVLEKCFELAGQTITGDWIDSERFKRMVIGFSGGDKITISPSEVAQRQVSFDAEGAYDVEINKGSYSFIPPGFDLFHSGGYYIYQYGTVQNLTLGAPFWSTLSVNNDTLLQLDTATGIIQVARTGNYKIAIAGSYDSTKLLIGSSFMSQNTASVKIQLVKNGTPYITMFNGGLVNATTSTFNYTGNINVHNGDLLEIRFVFAFNATVRSDELPADAPHWEVAFEHNNDWTFNIESIQAPLVNGDDVNVANFLPDLKCSEFVKGLLTAYNLYVSDPDIKGNVEILPLDDYYNPTNVFDDWTLKLDHGKTRTISPSSNIEGKIYAFKFLQDDDYWNKYYRALPESGGIGYGDYNYQVPSTFQTGQRVYQLPWAQTLPVQIPGSNIIVPTIIQRDEATGIVKPYKGKPRVFYYQGLRTSDSWVLRNSATPATSSTFTEYPAISHIDDYDNPTFDYVFGPPAVVQWLATDYTDINLFTEYTYKFIKEITGKDSKLLTAYFLLNEEDVQTDKFKTLAMINGVLFRKNIIKDFQANASEPTLCELAKVVTANKRRSIRPFVRPGVLTASDVIIGAPSFDPGNTADTAVGIVRSGKNNAVPSAGIIYGGYKNV